jgi:hypothetical protein
MSYPEIVELHKSAIKLALANNGNIFIFTKDRARGIPSQLLPSSGRVKCGRGLYVPGKKESTELLNIGPVTVDELEQLKEYIRFVIGE